MHPKYRGGLVTATSEDSTSLPSTPLNGDAEAKLDIPTSNSSKKTPASMNANSLRKDNGAPPAVPYHPMQPPSTDSSSATDHPSAQFSEDLEKLRKLKETILAGQHPQYKPIPQPDALAALYLGSKRDSEVFANVPEKGVGKNDHVSAGRADQLRSTKLPNSANAVDTSNGEVRGNNQSAHSVEVRVQTPTSATATSRPQQFLARGPSTAQPVLSVSTKVANVNGAAQRSGEIVTPATTLSSSANDDMRRQSFPRDDRPAPPPGSYRPENQPSIPYDRQRQEPHRQVLPPRLESRAPLNGRDLERERPRPHPNESRPPFDDRQLRPAEFGRASERIVGPADPQQANQRMDTDSQPVDNRPPVPLSSATDRRADVPASRVSAPPSQDRFVPPRSGPIPITENRTVLPRNSSAISDSDRFYRPDAAYYEERHPLPRRVSPPPPSSHRPSDIRAYDERDRSVRLPSYDDRNGRPDQRGPIIPNDDRLTDRPRPPPLSMSDRSYRPDEVSARTSAPVTADDRKQVATMTDRRPPPPPALPGGADRRLPPPADDRVHNRPRSPTAADVRVLPRPVDEVRKVSTQTDRPPRPADDKGRNPAPVENRSPSVRQSYPPDVKFEHRPLPQDANRPPYSAQAPSPILRVRDDVEMLRPREIAPLPPRPTDTAPPTAFRERGDGDRIPFADDSRRTMLDADTSRTIPPQSREPAVGTDRDRRKLDDPPRQWTETRESYPLRPPHRDIPYEDRHYAPLPPPSSSLVESREWTPRDDPRAHRPPPPAEWERREDRPPPQSWDRDRAAMERDRALDREAVRPPVWEGRNERKPLPPNNQPPPSSRPYDQGPYRGPPPQVPDRYPDTRPPDARANRGPEPPRYAETYPPPPRDNRAPRRTPSPMRRPGPQGRPLAEDDVGRPNKRQRDDLDPPAFYGAERDRRNLPVPYDYPPRPGSPGYYGVGGARPPSEIVPYPRDSYDKRPRSPPYEGYRDGDRYLPR